MSEENFCFRLTVSAVASLISFGCPPEGSSSPAESEALAKNNMFEEFVATAPTCVGTMMQIVARNPDEPAKPGDKPTSNLMCVSSSKDPNVAGRPIMYRVDSKPCPSFVKGLDRCRDASECELGKDCVCAGWVVAPPGAKKYPSVPRKVIFGNACRKVDCPDNCGGLGCAEVYSDCGVAEPAFRCHTPQDECGGSKGTCDGRGLDTVCDFDEDKGHWACVGPADCYKAE